MDCGAIAACDCASVLSGSSEGEHHLLLIKDATYFAVHLPKCGVSVEVDPLVCEVHGLVRIQMDAADAREQWEQACLAGLDALQSCAL